MPLHANLRFVNTTVPDLEGAGVTIVRVELWQGISELFSLALHVRCPSPNLEMRDVVGQIAEVSFFRDVEHQTPQPFLPLVRGLVRRARQLSVHEVRAATYELVIVPPLWLTSLRSVCEVFNELTAPEIVANIVSAYERAGLMAVAAPATLPATRRREYTTQYNEADLHCIRRVLAEDGLAFIFDGDGLSDFVLLNDTSTFVSGVRAALPILPSADALHGDVDAVLDLERGRALRPGKHRVRDYHFDNPFFHPTGDYSDDGAFELVGRIGARRYEEGALHEHGAGGSVLMTDDGREGQARLRAEGRRRDHEVLTAELTCPVPAGARLTIVGDPGTVPPEQLVVRAVSVFEAGGHGEEAGGREFHRVECIPADYPYRPPLLPKTRIHGLQRASVAGSEDIDVDEHGRVAVVFQWDDRHPYDEWQGPPELAEPRPTRRISVSQDWAGPSRGFLTLPRLGDEVVVAYIDGDPDEPVIVGRLYNGRHRAAVKLPENRTQSVWRSQSTPGGDGFHEIRFEDRAGAEELHVEAQRLSTRLVKGAEAITVGGDRHMTVGGSQYEHFGNSLETKAGFLIHEKAAGHIIEAGLANVVATERIEDSSKGEHTIMSGAVTIRAPTITLQAGGSVIRVSAAGILIQGPIVDINP